MARLLPALGALSVSTGVGLGMSTAWVEPPKREVVVIGNVMPVFLGSMTVAATALPPR